MAFMDIQLKHFVKASCLILLSAACAHAQTRKVMGVPGRASIVNITPEQAKQKAIDEAKAEALRLAGVEEWVQTVNFLQTREANNQVTDFFHSLTSVQTMGNVTSWSLVSEDKIKDESGNLVYEVLIDAEVKLYKTRPDPEFVVNVKGLAPVYKNGEDLAFTALPNSGGYLSVFIIDHESNVVQLYPNTEEPMMPMVAAQSYSFPMSKHYRYEVFTNQKEETDYVFFLFTKSNIPWRGTSFQSFIEHVYRIEPWERFVEMERIVILGDQ
jgi:hypothetical protein